jgi:hypothetical protein
MPEPDWDLRALRRARFRAAYLPGKGSRGGAEPRGKKIYKETVRKKSRAFGAQQVSLSHCAIFYFRVSASPRANSWVKLCFPRTALRESENPGAVLTEVFTELGRGSLPAKAGISVGRDDTL